MADRQVGLLRGINLGSHQRISMPALRERLSAAGYEEPATYLQSGNIVLTSELGPRELERELQERIASWFQLQVPVLVRTAAELAEVVAANPLRDVVENPKRYQVSFLSASLDELATARLRKLATEPERVEIIGREVYAWHPAGVQRSRLASALASRQLGVSVTARNWTTVTALLELAER